MNSIEIKSTEIHTKRTGSYRGISIVIEEIETNGGTTFKWHAGLRGHGEADSYEDAAEKIRSTIDRSLARG